jgi:SEC-C motif-containing protein
MENMEKCPCGSGATFTDCCQPVIKGSKAADSPEVLMRARYSAHAVVDTDFLFESTHPDHRQGYDHQATQDWSEKSEWLGLEIIDSCKGGAGDSTGEVEFIASYNDANGVLHKHHENALFKKQDGKWYFTDGELVKQKPLIVEKIGRNDPCKCGSGLKYKKCCGK